MSLKRDKMCVDKLNAIFNSIDEESDPDANVKISWIIHELCRMKRVKAADCVSQFKYLGYSDVFDEEAYHACASMLKRAADDIYFGIACKCEKILDNDYLRSKDIFKVLENLKCIPVVDINKEHWQERMKKDGITDLLVQQLRNRVAELLYEYC